jgi:hypothetical protein
MHGISTKISPTNYCTVLRSISTVRLSIYHFHLLILLPAREKSNGIIKAQLPMQLHIVVVVVVVARRHTLASHHICYGSMQLYSITISCVKAGKVHGVQKFCYCMYRYYCVLQYCIWCRRDRRDE